MGWNLSERSSLPERIKGDFVLGLALIHHLRISSNIPLKEIVEMFHSMAPEGVLEWVDCEDSMVKKLLTIRKNVYDDYSRDQFEKILRRYFRVVDTLDLCRGTRRLYHLKKK